MRPTESTTKTYTELERIAWLSAQDPHREFHSLMHHFHVESLRACYDKLNGRKAVGADGIDKARYGEDLLVNLDELIKRMKRMSYRPGPVRLVQIPKEGKAGATRPLGISNFEDKLVQKRVQELLESIYDPIFLDCSFGFRPGRGCHDAIKALHQHLFRNEVEVVIDVDLENFFGSIDHTLLEEMLRTKIKDTKFMRYIIRMFKAGVLSEGDLRVSDEGVAQGSCCSPVLANIFAHYVIDEWFEETVKQKSKGQMSIFRYADDLVVCCRHQQDASWFKEALVKRLGEFNLKLNEDKTKLVSFSKSKEAQGIKQGAFNFLGFTFYLGKSRKGVLIPKLKTEGKRLRSKLKNVNAWARMIRNRLPLREIWRRFVAKLRGHFRYYGVSFNIDALNNFLYFAHKIMFKWLNRRSQRRSFNWEKFRLYIDNNPLPKVEIHHKLF